MNEKVQISLSAVNYELNLRQADIFNGKVRQNYF